MLPKILSSSGKSPCRFSVLFLLFLVTFLTEGSSRPVYAAVTINTGNAADWVITNGTLKLDWISTNGRLSGVFLNGVDVTDVTQPSKKGVYMDDTGAFGGGATTTGYQVGPNGSYVDWWITFAASSTNAFTFSEHFLLTSGATGFSVYCVATHAATDPSGGLGQIQYVFRINNSLCPNAYYYDTALNNLGETITPLPNNSAPAIENGTNGVGGRNVQNAVYDQHGLTEPAGWLHVFDTKYDRCTYQYLHQADGAYGSQYGIWTVLPSKETLCGGPTHQCLDSEGLLIMECLSGHLDNPLAFSATTGIASSHCWGPFYFHINKVSATLNTPYKMYQDAIAAGAAQKAIYDTDTALLNVGYTPAARRGSVVPTIARAATAAANTGWVVLSDPSANTQLSCYGMQYWVSENSRGNAALTGVVPGTYRLSYYQIGQWGEMRNDNVTVNPGQTTVLHGLTFVPENFGAAPPIWTIGTPDRSAHEFLHGHYSNGRDDREYYGAFDFWADFASTNGAVVYNATNGPGYTATNDLSKFNYLQWVKFYPSIFAGVFTNDSDVTDDGYKYYVPAYVGDPSTANCPPWTIHFTTTAAQLAQGKYAVLSLAMAAAEGDAIPSLNGHTLVWHAINNSDADLRSGLSGFTQWAAFQWDTTALNPVGQDNVLTLSVNRRSVLYDALRFEITNTSADPAVRGWHDYQYIYNKTEKGYDDSLPNP